MDWIMSLRAAVDYMEEHLADIRSPQEVAEHVYMSAMHLERGFRVLSGYTIGEYIRNRRLYLAALELVHTPDTVLDIALRYGYDTPAGFEKAFARFHGATPLEVRRGQGGIRSFHRLKISISMQGGESMQFRVEKKAAFCVTGFRRTFDGETSYQKIPEFWDEIGGKYASGGDDPVSRYVMEHHIGEFGVCLDDVGPEGQFDYMIAGTYTGGAIPEGFSVQEIPENDWAVFDCTLATLQETNTAIWKEWLPGNAEYDVTGGYTVEWYSGIGTPEQHKCAIWIPVRRR